VVYEISFTKPLVVADSDIYINDCCWGGDVVRDQLLPLVSSSYEKLQTGQEDWGWFLWFRRGPVRLAIDICCDNSTTGEFRVRLSSQVKRGLFGRWEVATPQLEEIRRLVTSQLEAWAGKLHVELV
jgi:hypothetical protein